MLIYGKINFRLLHLEKCRKNGVLRNYIKSLIHMIQIRFVTVQFGYCDSDVTDVTVGVLFWIMLIAQNGEI